MKEKILNLLEENPKHAVNMIFKNPKYNELKCWIEKNCDPISNANAIKVYTAITGEKVLCPCGSGKLRKLESIKAGFFFCGRASACSAARKAVSEHCVEAAKHWDKKAANEKRAKTNLEIYGMKITCQSEKVKNAQREFYKNPENVKKAVKKGEATCFKNNGVTNISKIPDIVKQRIKTRKENALKKFGRFTKKGVLSKY